ncbi:hypothetical protein [Roseiterribacter gracilis]|uniref:Uncharacterized protein n=1 Tax=Roseiterribacter gracilis TaxID=2812848 RepID=A0A8S8XI80_9PROT|nr:hypothetical protein TMPK1_39880 [Rhodospirillales bacterium TMPK1]
MTALIQLGGLLCLLCCAIAGARVVLELFNADAWARLQARLGGAKAYWHLLADVTFCTGIASVRLYATHGQPRYALTSLLYLAIAIAALRIGAAAMPAETSQA